MSDEAKVGLLVIVFGALAIGTGLYLTDALARRGSLPVRIQFADVQGLQPGAQVRLGGVTIGRVTEVKLEPHPRYPNKPAAVKVLIDRDVPLYESDIFEIKQGAVVGDKYLGVVRPARVKPRNRLAAGAVVEGAGATSTEVIMDETRLLIASARSTVSSIQSLAQDEDLIRNLRGILANLNEATARAVLISQHAVQLAASLDRSGKLGEARVRELMDHLVSAADSAATAAKRVDRMLEVSPLPAQLALAGENIRQATEDVAALVAQTRQTVEQEGITDQLAQAVANLNEASANVKTMTENVAALTGDQDLTADLRQTLSNVRAASESLRNSARVAEELLSDQQTQEDLRATVSNLRQATESGSATLQRADGILSDVERTMAAVRRTQTMISDIEARPLLQMRGSTGGGLRADALLDLRLSPTARDTWRVGMRDLGDSERLDLLWSHPLGRDVFRAGIINSQLGVAYDRRLGNDVALEAELYDPDDLRLDVGMRWGLWKGYYLLLGVERVAAGTDPYIGVRYLHPFAY